MDYVCVGIYSSIYTMKCDFGSNESDQTWEKRNEKKNDKDQKLTWSRLHFYNQEDMVICLFFINFLLQFVLPFWNFKEFWP